MDVNIKAVYSKHHVQPIHLLPTPFPRALSPSDLETNNISEDTFSVSFWIFLNSTTPSSQDELFSISVLSRSMDSMSQQPELDASNATTSPEAIAVSLEIKEDSIRLQYAVLFPEEGYVAFK